MSNPFVPKKKVRKVIISHEISNDFLKVLEKLEIESITTPKIYDFPIASHPDILFHPIDEKTFIVDKNWNLNIKGMNKIKTKSSLEEQYPKDCPLNIGRLGKYFIGKKGTIDQFLEKELLQKGKIFQSINQGYVKCSTLYLSEEAFITQDVTIKRLGEKLGFRSYLIPSGNISLPPYDTGFIGGTGGLIDEKTLLFYGDPREFKYSKELLDILEKENVNFFYGEGKFIDLGSIIGIGD